MPEMIWPLAVFTRTCWPGDALFIALPSDEIAKPSPAATTFTVCPIDTADALLSMSRRSGMPGETRVNVSEPTACDGSVTMACGKPVRSPSRATRSAAVRTSPADIARAAR